MTPSNENSLYKVFKEFCPFISEFIKEDIFFWNKISSRYQARLQFIKNELKSNRRVTFQRGFLDNWIQYKIGDQESIEFLKYVDNTVFKIVQRTTINLHDKIKRIVKDSIGNFDDEVSHRTFNSIGEIFVIEFFLSKDYSLEAIEVKIPNLKPIDFLFRSHDFEKYYLIEVINLHLDKNRIESKEKLIDFFKKRYLDKFKDKSKGNINVALHYNLKLFPIIWTESMVIENQKEFFRDTATDISQEMHILQGFIINEEFCYGLVPVSRSIFI